MKIPVEETPAEKMDPSRQLALVHSDPGASDDHYASKADPSGSSQGKQVISIATISSGFEKGDFLVREEKGQRVYFDFFEEVRRRSKSNFHFVICCTLNSFCQTGV